MRPLFACAIKGDYKNLGKVWRNKKITWRPCHFYKLIEFLLQRQDKKGIEEFVTPQDQYITPFYEAEILQTILDENPMAPADKI